MKPIILLTTAFLAIAQMVTATDEIEVHHLGIDNAMVRVNGDAKYLILPVQESTPDAKVDILVDGNLARTIYVRLVNILLVILMVPLSLVKLLLM